MANLTNPRVIWLKGGLFVVLGAFASILLIAQRPDLQCAVLLAIVVWSFCRDYFAFYVIEHYIDPTYRFTGLLDFARYAVFGSTSERPNGG